MACTLENDDSSQFCQVCSTSREGDKIYTEDQEIELNYDTQVPDKQVYSKFEADAQSENSDDLP